MAVVAYNRGIEHRTRGLKAEEKNPAKAREEYQKALDQFKQAAELNVSSPQAWNGMGFAYRKLGDFTRALQAYDRALTIAPSFPDAIEYRGEAYLSLDRLEDAKQAYLTLFAIDRKQAELLMRAMAAWIARRKTDAAGVDPDALSAFEVWVKERAALAHQTRAMGRSAIVRAW
jgi:tetratricopeptide (TPR) repeat protein